MRIAGFSCLAFGVVFVVSMIAHDIFVFAEVRACINASIQNLSPSESQPNAAVRKAFHLDADWLHGNTAFAIYRDEFYRRRWDEHASFHSHKIPATLTWALALWLSFDRKSVESYRLRRWRAEEISAAIFGKPLNALEEQQLKEVVRVGGRQPSNPVCPW